MRRDPHGIGRAAVEAEERLPLLDVPEPRESGQGRPLQLGRRAGRERRAGPRGHQPDEPGLLPRFGGSGGGGPESHGEGEEKAAHDG